MKVLISAYACEPGKGSEPEVGWRWAMEMSKHHEVTVLTRSNNEPVIRAYFEEHKDEGGNIQFEYFDLGERVLALKKKFRVNELYYILWQRRARRRIVRLIEKESIDLVHLVTFASFRYPVFLNKLDVPVVWGPVGGGELAPWKLLWYRLRFPACVKEVLRNLATYVSELAVRYIDPTKTSGGCVVASTLRTQKILTKKGIRCDVMPTIGMDIPDFDEITELPNLQNGVRFIFVGRLVLLKGVHLLLEAFAQARMAKATLSIVGSGGEREYLEALTKKLDIADKVTFMGQVPKEDLPDLYARHHVVVGPSLYESGGYMVLEGFQQRRPAIVLDVGGPALSVDSSCGIKVPQQSGIEVVSGLADAMRSYADNPEMIAAHGQAGFEKLKNVYSWPNKAQRMAAIYIAAVQD